MKFAWDFILAEGGDTIKEKMELLLDVVAMRCFRSVDSLEQGMVTCGKEIADALLVAATFGGKNKNIEFTPTYKEVGNLFHLGSIKAQTKNKKYHCNFELYADKNQEEDLIIASNGKEQSEIKVFNYPFIEQLRMEVECPMCKTVFTVEN